MFQAPNLTFTEVHFPMHDNHLLLAREARLGTNRLNEIGVVRAEIRISFQTRPTDEAVPRVDIELNRSIFACATRPGLRFGS
jgi:hypothetical protein